MFTGTQNAFSEHRGDRNLNWLGRFCVVLLKIMKPKPLKVFIYTIKEKIVCCCLRERKMCDRMCEKGTVYYDQYEAVKECFRNKKEQ